MAKVEIRGDGTIGGSEIYLDGTKLEWCFAYELRESVDDRGIATLVLHLHATEIKVEHSGVTVERVFDTPAAEAATDE